MESVETSAATSAVPPGTRYASLRSVLGLSFPPIAASPLRDGVPQAAPSVHLACGQRGSLDSDRIRWPGYSMPDSECGWAALLGEEQGEEDGAG